MGKLAYLAKSQPTCFCPRARSLEHGFTAVLLQTSQQIPRKPWNGMIKPNEKGHSTVVLGNFYYTKWNRKKWNSSKASWDCTNTTDVSQGPKHLQALQASSTSDRLQCLFSTSGKNWPWRQTAPLLTNPSTSFHCCSSPLSQFPTLPNADLQNKTPVTLKTFISLQNQTNFNAQLLVRHPAPPRNGQSAKTTLSKAH